MATLKIGKAPENSPTQEAKQTWYADAEGNPTTDPSKAAFHIAQKGQLIQPNIVTKYGFVDGDIKVKSEAKSEAKATAPTENKAVEKKSDIKVADNRPGANKTVVKK